MMQNKNTLLILGKDLLFILLALFLVVRGRFLGAVVGVLFLFWYGRDFWLRLKFLTGPARRGNDSVEHPAAQPRQEDAPIVDDGKIQVTDLSGAKEVDFEKE